MSSFSHIEGDKKLLHFRHKILPLLFVYIQPNRPSRDLLDPASGFLVRVKGTVWLFTAGHVIDDLRSARDAKQLLHLYGADAWTKEETGEGNFASIPIDSVTLYLGSNLVPPDLGAIRIDYPSLTFTNKNFDVIDESHWHDQPTESDYLMVTGAPRELLEVKQGGLDSRPILFFPPAIVHADPIARPDYAKAFPIDRIYAQIKPRALDAELQGTVKNIVGMSGGPIFACKDTPTGFDYWIVGVQSAWYDTTKVVVCDYAQRLIQAIRALTD